MASATNIGKQKIDTALLEMPGIRSLSDELAADKPLAAVSILACVTPTPETGVFLLGLQQLGAKVVACSDNAFASDDDVVAYLRSRGVNIFAQSNMTQEEYFGAMDKAISLVEHDPTIQIIDDGCDITQYIARHKPQLFNKAKLITEQTTCGINALKHLYANGQIAAPAVNINNCFSKRWFDNYIGIQQSLVHALTVAGISIPGRVVTVFGYGAVGKGAARALRALGARVCIVEGDILLLMQAELDGYTPVGPLEALRASDICLSSTGCVDTISGEMIERHAKDGLILGNIGHGTKEYDVAHLEKNATKSVLNSQTDEFTLSDGRKVYSLCKGALVNFLAGGGNMPRLMGLTFTLTTLAHLQAAQNDRLEIGLHALDHSLEVECAERSFPHLVGLVYRLTDLQKNYMDTAHPTTA